MSYTTNPYLPKVRQQAVNLVYQGWSTRKVARHLGLGTGTVSKWIHKDPWRGLRPIPTVSSRPSSHPNALSPNLISCILAKRRERGRCAEVVHQEILKQGYVASLSSVKRTLARHGLIKKRSPWKRWHTSEPRPFVQNPGDLVQIDTIHVGPPRENRLYIYTLLDVCSRWAFAKVSLRINTHASLRFVRQALNLSPFSFSMLQSDHGSEFSTWFTEHAQGLHLAHRHSRVRTPNDNGHLERFNRTIQEECLLGIPETLPAYQRAISDYLPYYNGQRMHLGLNFKTPLERVQAID